MDAIQVEVSQFTSVTHLDICYIVKIVGPVCLEPRVYNIPLQTIITKANSVKEAEVIFNILIENIIRDYNREVEAMPIMDMFEDPMKYKNLHSVHFLNNPFDAWRKHESDL